MRVLIGFLVTALVAGLSLVRKPARSVTGVAGAATLTTFVWALAAALCGMLVRRRNATA